MTKGGGVKSDQSAVQITLRFNMNVYLKWVFLRETTVYMLLFMPSWLSASVYANCIDLKYLGLVLVNKKGSKKRSIGRVHHKYATHFKVLMHFQL